MERLTILERIIIAGVAVGAVAILAIFFSPSSSRPRPVPTTTTTTTTIPRRVPTTTTTHPSSVLDDTAAHADAVCQAFLSAVESIIWTRPVLSPVYLEQWATPSVAQGWHSSLTAGEILRHTDVVASVAVALTTAQGHGVWRVEAQTSLSMPPVSPITQSWTCTVSPVGERMLVTDIGMPGL
jgi:hypothetical protein